MHDVIIIGSGVSGMAAALYCGRFMLKTLVLGDSPGGTLNLAGLVENYPGFKSIQGMELADNVAEHARGYGIKVEGLRVERIAKKGRPFEVSAGGKKFQGKALILATGSRYRNLEVRGEEEFRGRGVHNCAICDGPLYRGKVLAVVGGSDSAAKETLVLSDFARKVYIIYRRERIRAEPINLGRVERKIREGKIEIITSTNVTEIRGGKFVTGVVLDRPWKGKRELPLDGLFVEIGHIPLSELAVPLGVKLNGKGEILTDKEARTNVAGVFAAGDVTDTDFKQAITGAAEGTRAAYSAYRYVTSLEVE